MEDDASNSSIDALLAEVKELENDLALADYELLKEQVKLFGGLYARRDKLVAKIPQFWLRVFEYFFESSIESPNIEDFELLSHLESFKVSRDKNEPKQVDFLFTFTPNDYLADDSLTLKKSFSNVQSPDHTSKVTSAKVPIKWKPGKDLTKIVKGAPQSFFAWFAYEGKGHEREFPNSADIIVVLADEIYPHAHKIFQESVVEESEEVDEDEDIEESDEDEDEEADEGGGTDKPPRKKQRSQ